MASGSDDVLDYVVKRVIAGDYTAHSKILVNLVNGSQFAKF